MVPVPEAIVFLTMKVRYSFMPAYFSQESIAENCARNLTGDCGVQTLLFITLCRCAGIPAKWESGWAAEPGFCGAHDWARFYVVPYGWLYADVSYGGDAAQLGEHLPYKQRVIGSSPIGPIIYAISYGEIAQLARAHGSYPWCRGFESPSRYLTEKSVTNKYGILAQDN